MSLRDEIAQKLFFEEHGTMEQWGREDQYYNPPYYALADALMPLVERAVKEGINLHKKSGIQCGAEDCEACAPAIDAIVARIMEGVR